MVKEDMAEVEVTEEIGTTGDGKSAVATPDGKKAERRRRIVHVNCNQLQVLGCHHIVCLCRIETNICFSRIA